MAVGDLQWLRSRVQYEIGDASGEEIHQSILDSWINDGQNRLCARAEMLEELATQTTVAGTAKYALPNEYLTIIPGSVVYDEGYVRESNTDEVYKFDQRSSDDDGVPYMYDLWNNFIRLYPAPSEAKTLTYRYIRVPNTLSENADASEVQERYHSGIIAYAKSKALDYLALSRSNSNEFSGQHLNQLRLAAAEAKREFAEQSAEIAQWVWSNQGNRNASSLL